MENKVVLTYLVIVTISYIYYFIKLLINHFKTMTLTIDKSHIDKITGQAKVKKERVQNWDKDVLDKKQIKQLDIYFREQLYLD
jgi:hypothetical protein